MGSVAGWIYTETYRKLDTALNTVSNTVSTTNPTEKRPGKKIIQNIDRRKPRFTGSYACADAQTFNETKS